MKSNEFAEPDTPQDAKQRAPVSFLLYEEIKLKKGMKYPSLIFILALLVAYVIIFTPQKYTLAVESSARFNKRYKEIMDSNLDRPIDKQQLKETTAADAFKYFSGNTTPVNKFPAMYVGSGQLIVLGYEYYKEFPIDQFQKAVEAYKELLILEGIIDTKQK